MLTIDFFDFLLYKNIRSWLIKVDLG